FLVSRSLREAEGLGEDADLGAVRGLARDVADGGRVVADDDGGETGSDAACVESGDPLGDVGLDFGCDAVAIDELGCHWVTGSGNRKQGTGARCPVRVAR